MIKESKKGKTLIELALYQPDIPQNTGTLMRLCACWDLKMHLIEPLGFVFNTHKMRRAGMDYMDHVDFERHSSFDIFMEKMIAENKRIVLSTTKSSENLYDFSFQHQDVILMGRESAGVPEEVHEKVHQHIRIPMKPHMRSMNMAVSASIILSESLRQISAFPPS